tara:strand:+ start:450 stop:662 length:213 start_codon:yes stop_codon:yes gene_type:complete
MNNNELYEEMLDVMCPILDEVVSNEMRQCKEVFNASSNMIEKVTNKWYEIRYLCSRSRKELNKLEKIGIE